jgi:putative membrane protein
MKAFLRYAPLALAGALAIPFAAADKVDKTPITDQDFVAKTGAGNLGEISLAKLAETNASSEDVKDFARRMIRDHKADNEKLMGVAKAANALVPTELDKEAQAMEDKLSSLEGADFDKAYMKAMVEDHEKDVNLFEAASKSATDPGVRSFAGDLLPTLQEHLKMARTINDKISGK